MRPSSLLFAAALALATVGGCADAADDRPATFAYIVPAILRPSCATATCHNAMTRREGMDFSTVEAAAQSIDDEGLVPIGGGDPADSQLIFLLTDATSKRMPIDSPLPAADIALIAAWIADGAVH